MRGPIFISYASEDRHRAREVQRSLEAVGWTVWIDDDGIRGAARWAGEIERAIREAAAMVLLLSHRAATSEWVDRELVAATERGLPIVTAELEPTPLPDGMEFVLRARQRVRLTTDQGALTAQSRQRLDTALVLALKEKEDSRPARGRLALGRAIGAVGCLAMLAGFVALFAVGLLAVDAPIGDFEKGPVEDFGSVVIAIGLFAVGMVVAGIGKRLRRSARLKALRREKRRP